MTDKARHEAEAAARVETERAQVESGDAFALAPGSKILLEMDCPPLRFWGEYLGVRKGEYLILVLPGRTDVRDCLLPEQPLTARYLHKDYNICGFQTFVAAVARKPYPLLFLSYPWRIEVINLRHDERVTCFFKSSIFVEGLEHQGFMINLSASGARFALDAAGEDVTAALQDAKEAFCLFRITGDQDDLYIRGEIKSILQKKKHVEFGLRFLEIEEKPLSRITEYVCLVRRFFNQEGV